MLRASIGFIIAGLLVCLGCNDSDFTSAAKQTSGEKKDSSNENDVDNEKDNDNDDTGPNNDDEDIDTDSSEQTIKSRIDELLKSDEKISTDDGGLTLQRFTADDSAAEVDVAFVIDMSGSMDAEIKKVKDNLQTFLTDLADDPKSKNTHLFVLAGKNDLTFSPPTALVGNPKFSLETTGHNIDSFNLLTIAKGFLGGSYTSTDLKLRASASKHIIFVTDDQAKRKIGDGTPAAISEADFRSYLETSHKDEKINFHGIVCKAKISGCDADSVAYKNLAASHNGVVLELTTSDWTPLFNELAKAIAKNETFEFKLNSEPEKASSIKVYVDKELLDTDSYEVEGDNLIINNGTDISGKSVFIVYK